jgi:hypothetical protein
MSEFFFLFLCHNALRLFFFSFLIFFFNFIYKFKGSSTRPGGRITVPAKSMTQLLGTSPPRPPGRRGPAPRQSQALPQETPRQSQSVSTFTPFLASALSQNGASSEAAEVLVSAEADPEVTEIVRKLPKDSTGEGGWRISSQDSERTGSKSV